MPEEYELEYKEFDAKAFVARLSDVKWGLVAMAACCFSGDTWLLMHR